MKPDLYKLFLWFDVTSTRVRKFLIHCILDGKGLVPRRERKLSDERWDSEQVVLTSTLKGHKKRKREKIRVVYNAGT
jgi:hypothetical protein